MPEVEAKSPVLQMRHISKRFDTTQALDDVSHVVVDVPVPARF